MTTLNAIACSLRTSRIRRLLLSSSIGLVVLVGAFTLAMPAIGTGYALLAGYAAGNFAGNLAKAILLGKDD